MSSVWYKMGIRDGEFHGVDQGTFFSAGSRFFLNLTNYCRQSVQPGYLPDDREMKYSFAGLAKYKTCFAWDDPDCQKRFLYKDAPMGTPLSLENWEAAPRWDKDVLKPDLGTLLKETPVTLGKESKAHLHTGELDWQKQLLKLIQVMRRCIVPLEIRYIGNDGQWHEWFGNTGCLNTESFRWGYYRRLQVKIPDIWLEGGGEYKIGVYSKNTTPEYEAPIDGSFWKAQQEYNIFNGNGDSLAISDLRIYGVVDLSSHPDFRDYF